MGAGQKPDRGEGPMRPFRANEYPLDRCVTGPHVEVDDDGEPYLVYQCELCNTVTTDPAILRGCYNCDDRVGWR